MYYGRGLSTGPPAVPMMDLGSLFWIYHTASYHHFCLLPHSGSPGTKEGDATLLVSGEGAPYTRKNGKVKKWMTGKGEDSRATQNF